MGRDARPGADAAEQAEEAKGSGREGFERDPNLDGADGESGRGDGGVFLELGRVFFLASGGREPAAQQPRPGVAKPGDIVDAHEGIFSGFEGEALPGEGRIARLREHAGEVVDLTVAGAGR